MSSTARTLHLSIHGQRHVGRRALVGAVCGFLSAYLMLKGWSLIGDALSHAIVPGVAGAYMLGLPFSIGAFFSGGLAALAMLFLNQRTKLREDAIIGLIFTSFFALGLFMVSLNPTSVDVQTIVLGNMLADHARRPAAVVHHRRGVADGAGAEVEGPDGNLLRREPMRAPSG
jgi:ABC-type Mn2+/Zn2+ transport system permease subunit